MKFLNLFLFFLFIISCQNKIESNATLNSEDLQRLKNMKLLDKDEKVIQFYSEYKNKVAGSFFTDKRIANYWLNDRDILKNKVDFAFYEDIKTIEPFFKVGITYSPYILVTKSNNKTFKAYVNGTEKEKDKFLVEAVNMWKKSKDEK